jgi:hypothetical protein
MPARSVPAVLHRHQRQQRARLRQVMHRYFACFARRLAAEWRLLDRQRRDWLARLRLSRPPRERLLEAHVSYRSQGNYLLEAPLEMIADDPRVIDEVLRLGRR